MRRCLRDPTFSRFDTTPECDRDTQTHTHTHRHTTTAYTALNIASRGKKSLKKHVTCLLRPPSHPRCLGPCPDMVIYSMFHESIQGFRSHRGLKITLLYWFGYWLTQQLGTTVQAVMRFMTMKDVLYIMHLFCNKVNITQA